jgi:hydrophobe/amphiphile efflux-3 (HAE3) family protein
LAVNRSRRTSISRERGASRVHSRAGGAARPAVRRRPARVAPDRQRTSWLDAYLRRPLALLALAVIGTAALGFGISKLQSDARADLLVDPGSEVYRGQALFADAFGADPIVVMLEARPGGQLLTPEHMVGMATLEGKLSSAPGVKKVYGPGTVVNTFATEVTRRALQLCGSEGKAAETKAMQAAAAAGRTSAEQQATGQKAFDAAVRDCAQRLAQQYPSLGVPAVDNPTFYEEVLLEPDGKQVRPFWRWAMPDPQHGLISVRLDRRASLDDVHGVLRRIDDFKRQGQLQDVDFHVSGAPVLAASLADSVRQSLVWLLPVTLLAMLLVTGFTLRIALRVIAVPIAALAALWTAGAAGLLQLPLTPATLAVLPVVLGLATDYTLQATNRLAEEQGPAAKRVRATAAAILPATGLAALATAGAVLAFALSPIPLVRQFALFMALSVALAYAASVLVGIPLLGLASRPAVQAALTRRIPGLGGTGSPNWGALARAGSVPLWVALPVILVGCVGWLALPNLRVETDPSRLMPAGNPALAEAEHVRRTVGVVGELNLVVVGPDVSSPEVVRWMAQTESRLASDSSGDLVQLSGLPAFLRAFNDDKLPDSEITKLILDRIPGYFSQGVVSKDHSMARAAYGTRRLASVEDDQRLVARFDAAGSPPAGYRAYPAGLAVLASDSLSHLRAEQLWLNLAALGVVLLVLTAGYRHPVPALLAVVPTAVAAGWGMGFMFLTGTRLSPITVLLAGVVVAFATEFSVLWLARFRSERRSGDDAAEAADTASRRVGPAIVASGLALGAGFLVLAISPVPMVRDFGLWCGLDIMLATAAVLVLLPPLARARWLPAW